MTDNAHPKSLAEALARLQMRLPEIKKTETAEVVTQKGTYSYAYANLSTISQQILPMLGELGLSFVAAPTLRDDGKFVLDCTLMHVSGEKLSAAYPLPVSGTPQATGSAITYGRRYCLCAMTGVAPEEDDDASAAEAEAATQGRTAQRARQSNRNRPAANGSQRTAQRAKPAGETPPLPGEAGFDADQATNPQLQTIVLRFDNFGVERAERLTLSSGFVGRTLTSARELTKREASSLIDFLATAETQPDPLSWLREQLPDGGEPS